MLRPARIIALTLVVCATIGLIHSTAQAGTILKLSLGSDINPDVDFSGGVLKTLSDGDGATTGDQNTALEFQDFLSGNADIPAGASFSMSNLVAAPAATTFGPLVIQNFTGGTLRVYDAANVLLVEGTLGNSALTGPIGPPATGALFTTTFAAITGGTLQPMIQPNTLTMSMSFTDISNGTGFLVSGVAPNQQLQQFQADATLNIAAQPIIPEPLSAVMLLLGTVMTCVACRRRGGC